MSELLRPYACQHKYVVFSWDPWLLHVCIGTASASAVSLGHVVQLCFESFPL